jgi:hypothetical protein
MRIVGNPKKKKKDSFRCLQYKGTNAETSKQQRLANKRRGLGTREKVSSRRINFESNTYLHGSKTRNLPI